VERQKVKENTGIRVEKKIGFHGERFQKILPHNGTRNLRPFDVLPPPNPQFF
jgi:hypothetical protein